MNRYTTLPHSGKARLLRLNNEADATVITTLDAATARAVARQFDYLASDLPVTMATYAATILQIEICNDWGEAVDFDTFAAPAEPVQLTRRLLSIYDNAVANGEGSAHTEFVPNCVEQLGQAVHGQGEAVRRAVREEVVTLLTGYDTVPVFAHCYDKWDQINFVLLVNTGLDHTPDEDFTRPAGGWDQVHLLYRSTPMLEPDRLDDGGDGVYLRLNVPEAGLRAWLTANRPHLT